MKSQVPNNLRNKKLITKDQHKLLTISLVEIVKHKLKMQQQHQQLEEEANKVRESRIKKGIIK